MTEVLITEPRASYLQDTPDQEHIDYEGLEFLGKELKKHHLPTWLHSREVENWAEVIVEEMRSRSEEDQGIDWEQLRKDVKLVARCHDFGKLSIDKRILNKRGRLSSEENSLMRDHPQLGFIMLESMLPYYLAVAVRQHHERYNGRGYPFRVKGKDILLEARVAAVADVVASRMNERPYHNGVCGWEVAWEDIYRYKGVHYDPQIADAALSILDREFKTF